MDVRDVKPFLTVSKKSNAANLFLSFCNSQAVVQARRQNANNRNYSNRRFFEAQKMRSLVKRNKNSDAK